MLLRLLRIIRLNSMKKKSYYVINIIILIITSIFLWNRLLKMILIFQWKKETVLWGTGAILGVILVHITKSLRLYLIILEQRIPIKFFFKQYIKTTLVNITLPIKSGELFKLYCYGTELNNYKISLLSILIDRYFDSIPLIGMLVILTSMSGMGKVSLVLWILLIFFLLLTILFFIFPSTYCYLNKFYIMNIHSIYGINTLKVLDTLNTWYLYVKKLIRGRAVLMLLLSGIAWVMEYTVLLCLSFAIGIDFSTDTFINYMNSTFTADGNLYVTIYTAVSAFIFLLLMCGTYSMSLIKKRMKI